MTTREMIRAVQTRAKQDNYDPHQAAMDMVECSALLGNVNAECREKKIAYNKVRLAAYNSEQAANRAKMIAETSVEYAASMEAEDYRRELVELIRSLRRFLETMKEERYAAKFQ